jgi:hypothetical protein
MGGSHSARLECEVVQPQAVHRYHTQEEGCHEPRLEAIKLREQSNTSENWTLKLGLSKYTLAHHHTPHPMWKTHQRCRSGRPELTNSLSQPHRPPRAEGGRPARACRRRQDARRTSRPLRTEAGPTQEGHGQPMAADC